MCYHGPPDPQTSTQNNIEYLWGMNLEYIWHNEYTESVSIEKVANPGMEANTSGAVHSSDGIPETLMSSRYQWKGLSCHISIHFWSPNRVTKVVEILKN